MHGGKLAMISSVIVILLLSNIEGFSIHLTSSLHNGSRETTCFNLLLSSTVNGEDSNISPTGTVTDNTTINVDNEQLQGNASDHEEGVPDEENLSSDCVDDENQNEHNIEPSMIDIENKKEKRVQVTFRYSQMKGIRPYFLTLAKEIKETFPDVIIERQILPFNPDENNAEDAIFEVIIDGRAVIGKTRAKWQSVRRNGTDSTNNKAFGMSVFVSMNDIETAILKARRKKRPSTTIYAQRDDNSTNGGIRLEGLKISEKKDNL